MSPHTCFTSVQPFLDEKTRSKVVLVYSEEEVRSALQCIPPERLYPVFGGTKEARAWPCTPDSKTLTP